MKNKTLILLLLLLTLGSFAQSYKLADFTEAPIPKDYSPEWYKLNGSDHEFYVDTKKGQLTITKATESDQTTFQVPNGILEGINRGEWGGKLVFKKNAEDQNEILIKKGNIKHIFKFKDQIYFLEGLAHLSLRRGALYRLDTLKGLYTPVKILDLDDSPEAYVIKSDSLLVTSSQSFFVIHDFKKDLIIEDAFWTSLYPNSMTIINNEIFVGMRGGYIKLHLLTKKITFYKYRH